MSHTFTDGLWSCTPMLPARRAGATGTPTLLGVLAATGLAFLVGVGLSDGLHAPDSTTSKALNPKADLPHGPAIPEGWAAWDILGPGCEIWVAPPEALAEAEVGWASCPEGAPAGCSRLVLPAVGTPSGEPVQEQLDLDPEGYTSPSGEVLMAFSRSVKAGPLAWQDHLVVDGEGAIRVWLRKEGPTDAGCWWIGEDLDGARRLLRVRGDGEGSARQAPRERLVEVPLEGAAPRLLRVENNDAVSWSAHLAPGGVLVDTAPGHRLWFNPAGTDHLEPVWDPAADGRGLGLVGAVSPVPGGVVLAVASADEGALVTWSPGDGARIVDDTSGGSQRYNPGSDGRALVWSEVGDDGRRHVKTASWPVDPGEGPRDLGLDPGVRAVDPFVVGCGAAVHGGATPTEKVVFDLQTGARTSLRAAPGEPWGKVLALDCQWMWVRMLGAGGGIGRVGRG